jgi:DUF4097 and DUF4098 domain-containing protein YvlB
MKRIIPIINIAVLALVLSVATSFAQQKTVNDKSEHIRIVENDGVVTVYRKDSEAKTNSNYSVATSGKGKVVVHVQNGTGQHAERSVATDPNVVVALTNTSGHITVRGWERNEVRVQTEDDKHIELRRSDSASPEKAATQIKVLFARAPNEEDIQECGENSDIQLDVPRGATVYLKTESGDLEIEDVAEAHVQTSSGDVALRHITKATEAKSANGDLSLEDSSGRVRLGSISGDVEARNVKAIEASDSLILRSTSGDISLDHVGQAKVEASTISGVVNLHGPLARGGSYDFKTTSGDVTLTIPENGSFTINAQVFEGGEIVTDFPLKIVTAPTNPKVPNLNRLVGTFGAGDATITLISITGTLRLRKNK